MQMVPFHVLFVLLNNRGETVLETLIQSKCTLCYSVLHGQISFHTTSLFSIMPENVPIISVHFKLESVFTLYFDF